MLRGQRSRQTCSRLRLHHAATLFIAALAVAHLLITYWTIQYEEVWVGLSPAQKLLRAFKVLLVDAYKPRTKVRSSSCQVADHIPKVRTRARCAPTVPDDRSPSSERCLRVVHRPNQ